MRPSLDEFMVGIAQLAAKRTTCIRRGVGCVLANARGHVLAVGYNGVAAGLPHCNELKSVHVYHDNPRVSRVKVALSDPRISYVAKPDCLIDRKTPAHWCFQFYGAVTPVLSREPGDRQCVGFEAKQATNVCQGHDLPPGQDSCEAVHAEQNAILQCRDPWQIETAYVTLSPCKACLKLLLNTSCKRIVFLEEHTDPLPKALWESSGRIWEQFKGGVL